MLAGQVTAFFLFDVAEGVQLSALRSILGASAESPRLAVKPAVPAYVQYQEPPVQVDADALGLAVGDGAQARFKVYDYGVISVALTRAFRGSWSELHSVAQATASATLEAKPNACAARWPNASARRSRRRANGTSSEDYFVYRDHQRRRRSVRRRAPRRARQTRLPGCCAAKPSRSARRSATRCCVTGSRTSPTISSSRRGTRAFVYDTEAGVPGALEILEFANSQLLQFRYYDQLLDARARRASTPQLQQARWCRAVVGRRYTRGARRCTRCSSTSTS